MAGVSGCLQLLLLVVHNEPPVPQTVKTNPFYLGSGSVRRHYTPSNLKQTPYLNVSQLSSLDSDLMSFDQLVEFVQSNGNPRFKWPRKSKKQKGGQKSIKHMNYLSDKAIIPISLPHSSNSLPDTGLAQSTTASLAPLPPEAVPVPTSVSPVPRLSWGDDIEMVSTSSMVIKDGPKTILSFACRAGWNLNKKATWVPAAGITPEPCEFFSDASKIDYCLDQPSISSTIVFTRVPEKDVEAFLKNFLRCEEGLNNDLKQIA